MQQQPSLALTDEFFTGQVGDGDKMGYTFFNSKGLAVMVDPDKPRSPPEVCILQEEYLPPSFIEGILAQKMLVGITQYEGLMNELHFWVCMQGFIVHVNVVIRHKTRPPAAQVTVAGGGG